MSERGRPRSDGMRLNSSRARGVNSLIFESRSRNSVPISVELTRLRMSLFDWACSSILTFSSWLTVVSSSLIDCSSSLLVSSSSADDRSSSLIACSSSFEALSSSVWASYCSTVDRSWALTLTALLRAAAPRPPTAPPARRAATRGRGAEASSNSTRKKPRAGSPSRSTGLTVIVDRLRRFIDAQREAVRFDVGAAPRGLVEGRPQLEPQLGAHGPQQVVRGFAAGELQVAPGARREVHDVVVLVDDHGRRPVLLEQLVVQVGVREPLGPADSAPPGRFATSRSPGAAVVIPAASSSAAARRRGSGTGGPPCPRRRTGRRSRLAIRTSRGTGSRPVPARSALPPRPGAARSDSGRSAGSGTRRDRGARTADPGSRCGRRTGRTPAAPCGRGSRPAPR